MPLIINHNMMASNAARNLNTHYGALSNSVRRLSSGLRIGTAGDDAAGLAIRELMRAEIAALNQGVRNANDAISMIQTADGALQIIDEKLIRMKELAEQAATGTYNSDQRLMIDSEFQAMKAEIDRIAKSTDFNDVKMLCNDPTNKIIIDFDIQSSRLGGNYEELNNKMPIITETKILNMNAITSSVENLQFNRMTRVISYSGDSNINNWYGYESGNGEGIYDLFYDKSLNKWSLLNGTGAGEPFEFYDITGSNSSVLIRGYSDSSKSTLTAYNLFSVPFYGELPSSETILTADTTVRMQWFGTTGGNRPDQWVITDGSNEYPLAKVVGWTIGTPDASGTAITSIYIDLDGDGVADISQTFTQHADGNGHNGNRVDLMRINFSISYDTVTKIHFGPGNDASEDYYYIEDRDCTAKGLGLDSITIETQDKAQRALESLDDAIIIKDTARAYFGATQNRLENTVSNLQTQAENLQASESRISDVDVADEMTEFIRQQIMTQAAVAMLSQANSLPQMALQVIQGN